MLKSFLATLFVSFLCAFSVLGQETTAVGKVDSTDSSSAAQSSGDDDRRFQIGFHFTDFINKKNNLDFNNRNRPGFGGRIGYDFARFGGGKYVATAEAEVNFSPKNAINNRIAKIESGQTTIDDRTDGRVLQGLFGVKVGRKFDKVGIFGKARTGFIQYTNGKSIITNGNQRSNTATNLAADLGGVIEFYPTKRFITRFDFGDTIVRVGEQDSRRFVTSPTISFVRQVKLPARTQHNFQFSAGFGFRF
jgi:hypothetical protein